MYGVIRLLYSSPGSRLSKIQSNRDYVLSYKETLNIKYGTTVNFGK